MYSILTTPLYDKTFRDEEKSEFEGFIKDRDLVKGGTRI